MIVWDQNSYFREQLSLTSIHYLISGWLNLCLIAGGLMSIFLMGVWDPDTRRWCTVARCGNGHDDKTIEKLNKELKMTKISKVFRTFFDPASTFLKDPFYAV